MMTSSKPAAVYLQEATEESVRPKQRYWSLDSHFTLLA